MRLIKLRSVTALAAIVIAMGAAGTTQATPIFGVGETVSLEELIDGAVIEVGDKLFDDFVYNPTGEAPSADAISVTGFIDDDTGDIGLLFSGPFAVFGSPALGPSTLEAGILFDATILDPDFVFDSVTLAGTIGINGDTGFASLEETVVASPPVEGFGLNISDVVIEGEQGPSAFVDTVEFDDESAFTELEVTKDLFLTVGVDPDIFDSVLLTSFTQTFSQREVGDDDPGEVIPEPTTQVVALIGTLAFIARRRRGE